MRRLIAVLFALVGSAAAAAADNHFYETVRSADIFAAGPVGYAGTTSDAEAALHYLLSKPNPARKLNRLLSEGTMPGQLYALWGLAALRSTDFDKAVRRYLSVNGHVQTQNGCIVYEEAVSSIAERIRKGTYGKPAD